MNIYEHCPQVCGDRYLLRLVSEEDCGDLLGVYADPHVWPLLNGDNCNGDDFRYTSMERMMRAIRFWVLSYENGWFVRFAIVDRASKRTIGTIELFRREPAEQAHGTAVLRLDLHSAYETRAELSAIMRMVFPQSLKWFGCETVMTKIIPQAAERISAFSALGFAPSERRMTGNDGTEYGDYWEYTAK